MANRYLDLGTDTVPVGESISLDDLLMTFGGGKIRADAMDERDAPPNPARNAKRIAELEDMVDALFQTVEALQQQVKVLWEARRRI